MSPTLSVRNNYPAVCVKDRHVWARDSRLARAYAELPQSEIESLYEISVEDFWQEIVPALAADHGIDPADIGQTGRSGGWLIVDGTSFLDAIDIDQPNPYNDASEVLKSWQASYDDSTDNADSLFDSGECLAAIEVVQAFIDRDRFLHFATAIEQGMDAAGESFVERCLDAVRELDAARENAIVRGEN